MVLYSISDLDRYVDVHCETLNLRFLLTPSLANTYNTHSHTCRNKVPISFCHLMIYPKIYWLKATIYLLIILWISRVTDLANQGIFFWSELSSFMQLWELPGGVQGWLKGPQLE